MKQTNKIFAFLKSPSSDFFLFLVAVILLNLVASKLFFRIDLTSSKAYTLSASSREAVANLEEPLNIKVFFSKGLKAPYSNVQQYLKDLLAEYKAAGNKMLKIDYVDMSKTDEAEKIARSYGIPMVRIQEIKNNDFEEKSVYMGIAVSYADQIESIGAVTSTEGLEYDLTTAINKVVSDANILAGRGDEVKLTLYKSQLLKPYVSAFDSIDSDIEDAVRVVNRQFQDMIKLEKISPAQDEIEMLEKKFGIPVFVAKGEYATLSLVLSCGDKAVVVPLNLAKDFYGHLVSVNTKDVLVENLPLYVKGLFKNTTIAYSTGHGEHSIENPEESAKFKALLEDIYYLKSIALADEEIPPAVQTLIINGPKTAFSEFELYKIDQFLMKGGSLMLFVDSNTAEKQSNPYETPVYSEVDTGLSKLLLKYGISVGKDFVMDKKCYVSSDPYNGKMNYFFAPSLSKEQLEQQHSISKNLGYLVFSKAASVDISEVLKNKEVKTTVLARTSPASWEQSAGEGFVMHPMYIYPPADPAKFAVRNLAVIAEGKFESAFSAEVKKDAEDEKSEIKTNSHIAKSVRKGKIFVCGTSSVITSEILPQNLKNPTAYFFRNAVDYVNGNEDYCLMRTKTLDLNVLKKASGKNAESFNRSVEAAKNFNKFGLAVIVAIAGGLVFAARKKRREEIRLQYSLKSNAEEKND